MNKFFQFALVIWVLWAPPLVAQSTFGSILATVSDKTGAVVPGAAVLVSNLDSNAKRSTESGANGQYSLLNLPAGRYSLEATKAGFGPVRIPEILVDARQERHADLVMDLAAVTELVQVEATATAINIENGTISQTMNNQQITDLPANYRGSSTSPPKRHCLDA